MINISVCDLQTKRAADQAAHMVSYVRRPGPAAHKPSGYVVLW